MSKQTKTEYNSNIDFYAEVIQNLTADLSYYEALIKVVNPNKVLEIGCGSGRLFPSYIKSGVLENAIYGIDISSEMIKECQKSFSTAQLFCQDILDFNITSKFDIVIISNSMLKHIKSDEMRIAILSKAKELLTENGVISIDHSSYLYYESISTEWIQAQSSVVPQWFSNIGDVLNNYRWKKVIEGDLDRVIWQHISNEEVDFEIQFSTYIYKIEDLLGHLSNIGLSNVQILDNYPNCDDNQNHKRFIGIFGQNKVNLQKQAIEIKTYL